MVLGRTQPYVHLRVGIQIIVNKAQQGRLVLKRLCDSLDEGGEVKCYHVHVNAQVPKVQLNHRSHSFAILVSGVGDNGKLDRMSIPIAQRRPFPTEAIVL